MSALNVAEPNKSAVFSVFIDEGGASPADQYGGWKQKTTREKRGESFMVDAVVALIRRAHTYKPLSKRR